MSTNIFGDEVAEETNIFGDPVGGVQLLNPTQDDFAQRRSREQPLEQISPTGLIQEGVERVGASVLEPVRQAMGGTLSLPGALERFGAKAIMRSPGWLQALVPQAIMRDLPQMANPQQFVISQDSSVPLQMTSADRPILPGQSVLSPQAAAALEGGTGLNPQGSDLGRLLVGLSTPGNVVAAPATGVAGPIGAAAKTMFGLQGAGMIGENLPTVLAAPNTVPPEQRREAATAGMLGAMMLGGVLPRAEGPQGIMPEMTRLTASDLDQIAGRVPPERQLPPNVAPTEQRFAVTPSGQTVDLTQLTPQERIELLRGPREFVPREQQVRPAQQPPVIVGERPLRMEQPIVKPGQGLQAMGPVLEEALRRKEEPLGGQVSYEGQGIPSALQAKEMVPENVLKSREQLSGKKMFSGVPLPEGEGKERLIFRPALLYSPDEIGIGRSHESLREAFPTKRGVPGYVDQSGDFYTLTEVARKRQEGYEIGAYDVEQSRETSPHITKYSGTPVTISSLGTVTKMTPDVIAKELGLIYKEWPKEVPVIGGKGSYTDPKTGLTIENINRGTTLEEVRARMAAKLQEQYDTQGQGRIQGGEQKGQEPGTKPQPQGGTQEAAPGGVFQAPGTVEPLYSGLPVQGKGLLDRFFPEKEQRVVGGIQRLKDYKTEKAEATSPQGVGKIPLVSRLFDPRAYRTTDADKALLTHNYQTFKGQQMTALWLESRKQTPRAFPTDAKGQVELADGTKGYMEDVVRKELASPGSQPLTPVQKQFVSWWQGQWKSISKMLDEEGVKYFVGPDGEKVQVGKSYFPRPAIGKEDVKPVLTEQQKRVIGAKQFFQHERLYPSEQKGVEGGIKYEPDEYARVGRLLNAVYRTIADQRLAKDPTLGGVKGRPRFLEEGMVYHPAFRGQVFDAATAERLNKYYGEHLPRWLKAVSDLNDFQKAFQFTFDVSAPFNQGLPLMGVSPIRWAKATLRSYQALFSDKVLQKYISEPENLKAAQEIVANGGSISHLYDFLQGAGKGKLAGQIAPIRASARSMGTFLAIAKIELYKAFEPQLARKGGTKADLVEAVDNAVLSGKMESIGLTPGRAMGERLLLNAPSYARGAANLVTMAGQGKISGIVARRALMGMATAITLQMYALYKMTGNLTDDEIAKRFDPRRTEFLRYPYDLPNGERVELSYGNLLISIVRLLGDTVEVAQGKEVRPGLGNPWLRFGRYRLSPLASMIGQVYSGVDYRGEEVSATKTVAKSFMPISVEPLTSKESPQMKAVEAGTQYLGLNAYPESFGNRRMRELNKAAGKPYGEANLRERLAAERKAEGVLETAKAKPTSRQVLAAIQATEFKGKNVQKELSDNVRSQLEANNLTIPGYKTTKSFGKEMRLTEEEQKTFHRFQVEETEKRLAKMFDAKFSGLPADMKERRFKNTMEVVHNVAWARMIKEINAKKSGRLRQP